MLPIRQSASVLLLMLPLALDAAAQGASPAGWAREVVPSSKLGRRTLYVATPEGYERGRMRYPVLVLLDADDPPMFRLGIAHAVYLADNAGMPPMIVVGIVNGDDRIHDMTPPPVGTSVAEFKTAGGADAFADFIVNEAIPRVRAKYRTLPTTVLAGHSAGGLFALHAAATRPGAFQAVIAVSPALWYNDSLPARIYADSIARSSVPLRVFVASGGVDEPDIDLTTRRFAQRLDSIKRPTVALAYRHYPDDTHSLTPLSGLADGLRFAFEPVLPRRLPIARLGPRADSATVMRALAASEAMYADSARLLLLPERLPERVVNRLGYFALRTLEHAALSILVFQRNVELHPESARVHASLADGYLARGDTAAGIAHLRQAVTISRSSGAELPAEAHATLRKLEQRR